MFPKGGVTIEQLTTTGDSADTLALGHFCIDAVARALDIQCGVPFGILDLPIGVQATDRFITTLSERSGRPVPDEITDERGRVVDIITDMQQYFSGKRVALRGDPDTLVPLAEFLVDFDRHPCFNAALRRRYGRVHIPVAPDCNVQCGFCNRRYNCVNESRPGVT